MRWEFNGDVVVCASPPARCLVGELEGNRALAWGHDEGPFAFVVVVPDERHLSALLQAWRAA